MNKDQMELLEKCAVRNPVIKVGMLEDWTPRTLMYGYTCERHTFHLYLDSSRKFQKVVYDHDGILLEHFQGPAIEAEQCVPDKRLYPENCDFEFSRLVKVAGVHLPFTTYDENRIRQWPGKKLEDLRTFSVAMLSVPAFDLDFAELDLNVFCSSVVEEQVMDALYEVARGQMSGYVRSVVVRNEMSPGWIDVLPKAMESAANQVLSRNVYVGKGTPFPEGCGFAPHVQRMLNERAWDSVRAHLAKIT